MSNIPLENTMRCNGDLSTMLKKICKLLDCTVKGKHYNFFHSLPLPHPSLSYITKAVIPHTPWLPWQLVLFLLKCSAIRNIYLRGGLTFENIGENQVLKKKKHFVTHIVRK